MRPVIVVSGYTAAGKTTHGRLLADTFDLPFYSASTLLSKMARGLGAKTNRAGSWDPSVDEVRAQSDIDDKVDAAMIETVRYASAGVLDASLLPWIYQTPDVLNLWIESDLESRVRKRYVEYLGTQNRSIEDVRRLVIAKDEFSIRRLRNRYDFEFQFQKEKFDIVVDASSLIPDATPAAATIGVATLHTVLVDEIRGLLGIKRAQQRSPLVVYRGRRGAN